MPGRRQRMRTSEEVREAARRLRRQMTPAETALWRELRGRRLAGLKFRRQHAIGPFIADFCCAACRLVVELDGAVHAQLRERDAARTQYLCEKGYRVLRFPNDAVLHRLEETLGEIERVCRAADKARAAGPTEW